MGRLALLNSHLEQAKTNAKGLPWILVLWEKAVGKRGRRLVVLEYDEFLNLYRRVSGDDRKDGAHDRASTEG